MNIKYNRYVIFIAPSIWCIAAMISSINFSQMCYTLSFMFHNILHCILISHKNIYKIDNRKWHEYYLYIERQNIATAIFCIFGLYRYAIFSFIFIKYFNSKVVAFIFGALAIILYFFQMVFNIFIHVKLYIQPWCVLLLTWALFKETIKENMKRIIHRGGHHLIWQCITLESITMILIRWFTWCNIIFPHIIRWDVTFFGIIITSVLFYCIDKKFPNETLLFSNEINDPIHYPCPDKLTGEKCSICINKVKFSDVENNIL